MKFDKVIKERRSVREYSNKPVKISDIYKLIESARLAPSAGNREPWLFVVLKKDTKDKVIEIMEEQLKSIPISKNEKSATHEYNPASSLKESIRVIKEAPVFILVFRAFSEDWKESDYLSIGCAVEHLSLKATDLGLGSLWVRDVVYTRSKIAALVGYENLELVTGMVIGYSTEYPYERKKKSLEEIMICK